jgi:thiol-disulfide isomerase/thioredoxin
MPDIRDYVAIKIRPYWGVILTVIMIIIFILLGIYVFNKYGDKLMKKKRFDDVANESPSETPIRITMFSVDWCPHCKKALPEWDAFANSYHKKVVNGYMIQCVKLDCTDSSDPKVKAALEANEIDSYPTVIMMKGGERYDFDAKITKGALEQFVETVAQT